MFRLGLSVDPYATETASIVAKAQRSYKPEFAKNERDRKARAARMTRLSDELIDGPDIQRSAVYPGLGERWGRPPTQGLGIRVPENSVRLLTQKIVRGVYFLDGQKFVEPPYVITLFVLTDEEAAPIKKILDQFGQEYARGPGIVIRWAISQDDSMSAFFEIVVWAQIKMYASVIVPFDETQVRAAAVSL